MSYENWKNKAQGFQTVDVRHIQGSFFEGLKKRAEALEVGEGLHIIQTFEPYPLYAVMEGLGYEHHTEQRSEAEFHVWFCRTEKKEGDSSAPFKPLALLNYPMIDEKLGQIAVDFWETTWQSEKRTLPYETRLLLSLTNAVGAGRMRQAARELVKAYIHGVESAALTTCSSCWHGIRALAFSAVKSALRHCSRRTNSLKTVRSRASPGMRSATCCVRNSERRTRRCRF